MYLAYVTSIALTYAGATLAAAAILITRILSRHDGAEPASSDPDRGRIDRALQQVSSGDMAAHAACSPI